MYINDSLDCCGMKELSHIGDHRTPQEVVDSLIQQIGEEQSDEGTSLKPNAACYVFSEVGGGKYGRRLADFIKQHDLGTVVRAKGRENPNYVGGHVIRAFLWTPSTKGFKKYVTAHFEKKVEEQKYYWGARRYVRWVRKAK